MNNLPPATDATVGVSFDETNVHFIFNIQRSTEEGQGPPGEVTATQLACAIVGASSNTNGIATMNTPFTNDLPTLANLELGLAARRYRGCRMQNSIAAPSREMRDPSRSPGPPG